jgi:DNA polymerase-3 subunit delta'
MLEKVKGQPEGTRYLSKVVEGALTCPLLLIGPEGTGRRFSVVEAAREAFPKNRDPDELEATGYQLDKNMHPDFVALEPEGTKDIGVEAVREVLQQAARYPQVGCYKYLMIDGADRMTTAAANALLKKLEEPPELCRFFLLAENPARVLPTIRSRCGRVRYFPLAEKIIVERLSALEPDTTKSLVYARYADGSLGQAMRLWGAGKLTLRNRALDCLRLGTDGNLPALFVAIDGMSDELPLGLQFLEHLVRDMHVLDCSPDRVTNLDIVDALQELKSKVDHRLTALRTGFQELRRRMRFNVALPFHVKAYLASALQG